MITAALISPLPLPPQQVVLTMDKVDAERIRFLLSHMSYWSDGPLGRTLVRLADALDTVVEWDVGPSPFTDTPTLKGGA